MRKRITALFIAAAMLFSVSACGNGNQNNEGTQSKPEQAEPVKEERPEDTIQADAEPERAAEGKGLVIYFSCTGNTEVLAEEIAAQTGAELVRILPEEPYSEEDLNYHEDDCRANMEQNDDAARPAIAGDALDLGEYDTLYLGFPIWWGKLPKIMLTFLDTYDLSGKTVLPFCTSGGSGIEAVVSEIMGEEPDANVKEGLRVSGSDSADCADAVAKWLEANGGNEDESD